MRHMIDEDLFISRSCGSLRMDANLRCPGHRGIASTLSLGFRRRAFLWKMKVSNLFGLPRSSRSRSWSRSNTCALDSNWNHESRLREETLAGLLWVRNRNKRLPPQQRTVAMLIPACEWPNVADHRRRASDAQHETEASSRRSVHLHC